MGIKVFNPFDDISDKYEGRLMEILDSYETGYSCTIWFDYTRELFNKIKEGSFIVIKNFTISNNKNEDHYTILKITKKMPSHYASIERIGKSYPAFSEESIKGVRDSFTDQIYESFEDLTKIVVNAVPIHFQILIGDNTDSLDKINIEIDESLPILGESVKILHNEVIEKIVNGSLSIEQDPIIEIARLKDNENIKIVLDIESCLKTHFGIFGFTGVGKTNLLSTFISKIFEKKNPKKKVLFFDIMDEYLGLLLDLFFKENLNAYYIFLSIYDLNKDVRSFFTDNKIPPGMVERFYKQMVLPKELKNIKFKSKFCKYIEGLFLNHKILLFGERNRIIDWLNVTLDNFINTLSIKNTNIFKNELMRFFNSVLRGKFDIQTDEMNQSIKDLFEFQLRQRINKESLTKPKSKKASATGQTRISQSGGITTSFFFHQYFDRGAWETSLSAFVDYLGKSKVIEFDKYKDFLIDEQDIVDEIHSGNNNSLFIFVSSKEQDVRKFLNKVGTVLYNKRRNEGLIEPLTTLVFDEADTFIPSGKSEESVKESKIMVEQIARRGRKFGLGIGLATQRISFLETNILAQLHTYFISRLPRKYDRDIIKEAFSLSDEEFEATLKFVKGNWLLVSHEGLGLEGVPLSIKAENANERIKTFLEK